MVVAQTRSIDKLEWIAQVSLICNLSESLSLQLIVTPPPPPETFRMCIQIHRYIRIYTLPL